jgi:CO/xanthine dehydrogenase Mo-binding subunit
MARLKIIAGDTALTPNEGTTAGSFSMPNCAPAVQHASAEVRAILLDLASKSLNQPVTALTVADGTITGPGGAKTTYWDLVVGQALEREATGQSTPKAASAYRYTGKSVPRLDIPAKMTGEPIFVQEMRPEGLLHGYVVRPPTYRAKLASVEL